MDNSFAKMLGEIRGGDCLGELSLALQNLVIAVRETGKKGSVTLKLSIEPASRGKINALVVEDKVTTKLPELETATSLFFATDANTLQRNDPNQQELAFKAVQGGKLDPEKLKQVVN